MFSSNTSAVSGDVNYIEDVFSTWLYTGNGSTQTITNGIDVTGKGGLIWFKERASQGFSHALVDTARGNLSSTEGYSLASDTTSSQSSVRAVPTSSGFSLSGGSGVGPVNFNGSTYVSWTFRKQPKFFDVVTWTGNGTGSRAISHALDSTPGFIIFKRTDSADDWWVVHRSASNFGNYAVLNTTAAFTSSINSGISSVGSTSFTVSAYYNSSGATWVAYIFGHDAGGFGLTGTDNVISCGEFTTDGSGNATVNLGYEPQWALIKPRNSTGDWVLVDTMRSWVVGGNNDALLYANSSGTEVTGNNFGNPTATGFTVGGLTFSNTSYIYIAIRRGPMKTPTTGTSVYEGTTRTGTGAAASISGLSFPPDAVITRNRDSNGSSRYAVYDKLRGPTIYLDTAATDAEFTVAQSLTSFNQTGESFGTGAISNFSGDPYINWQFRRAPGFFDVVCYTGNAVTTETQAVNHNLGVAPELIFIKRRDTSSSVGWFAGCSFTASTYGLGWLNLTDNVSPSSYDNPMSAQPTATTFSVGANTNVNANASTYVAYLFASCPGVSKVGTYTGNGTSLTVNCGFTGGARFVLIKRTNSTGDWVVFDSARGIVAGNDPFLELNTNAAEQTGQDAVDADSTGFIVNQTAENLNVNGGTYIFLAIA